MTQDELKQKLWNLRCLLDELESKAEPVSRALGLQHKGSAVHHYLQGLEMRDAIAMYERLTGDQQMQFLKHINKGEMK